MRLRILHRTRYHYRAPVQESYNEVRAHPATDDKRRIEFFLLTINPPCRLRSRRDDFFNRVHWFEINEPHTSMTIEASMRVNTSSQYDSGRPDGCTFEDMRQGMDESLPLLLTDSRYISQHPDIWRKALDVRDTRQDVFQTAEAIMQSIFTEWTYTPAITTSSTHLREAWAGQQGVCQDFAHAMIGMCRALKIPARYVSGYLFNGPLSHLRGAQASHAWCEVHIPGRGWYGLDPTNNTLTDERYVKIATGRDYDDAAPVRGTFHGPPGAAGGIEVTVEVEDLS